MTEAASLYLTTSVDEAVQRIEQSYDGARARITDIDSEFRFEQQFTGTADLQYSTYSATANVESEADALPFVTAFWAEGHAEYSDGVAVQRPIAPMFWLGARPYTGLVDHAKLHAVTMPREAFLGRAAMMLGHRPAMPDRIVPAANRSRAGIDILLSTVPHAIEASKTGSPLIEQAVVDTAVAVYLALFDLGTTDNGRQIAPSTVRRAIAFMEEHATDRITITDVAAHVGVSIRTLHAQFNIHLDTTPKRHLTDLRMHAARQALQHGDTTTTDVTTIARAAGFTHLGRFAADYATRFGEYPRTTLTHHPTHE